MICGCFSWQHCWAWCGGCGRFGGWYNGGGGGWICRGVSGRYAGSGWSLCWTCAGLNCGLLSRHSGGLFGGCRRGTRTRAHGGYPCWPASWTHCWCGSGRFCGRNRRIVCRRQFTRDQRRNSGRLQSGIDRRLLRFDWLDRFRRFSRRLSRRSWKSYRNSGGKII